MPQPLVDGSIEAGRSRAPGLDQRGMEIGVEQVQPQHIRWLHGLRHRHEIRRDDFDVVSAWLLGKGTLRYPPWSGSRGNRIDRGRCWRRVKNDPASAACRQRYRRPALLTGDRVAAFVSTNVGHAPGQDRRLARSYIMVII